VSLLTNKLEKVKRKQKENVKHQYSSKINTLVRFKVFNLSFFINVRSVINKFRFSLIGILSLVVSFIICQKRFVLRTEQYFDHHNLVPCYKLLLLSLTTVIKAFIRRLTKFQVSL